MQLDLLTFVLTGQCNFACLYCRQSHRDKNMAPAVLDGAIDFFAPRLNPGAMVNFTGGEPLLAFPLLEKAVSRLEGRSLTFGLATNGSLLTAEMADFLDHHRFSVLLSWDGTLQSAQRGAANRVASAARLLSRRSGIQLETNTVVTPESVHHLDTALRHISDAGITAMHVTPDRSTVWPPAAVAELGRQLELSGGHRNGQPRKSNGPPLPLVSLPEAPPHSPMDCTAGMDRLAVSPRGEVWGCHRFIDYFDSGDEHVLRNRYSFGGLEEFVTGFPETYHRRLRAYRTLQPRFYRNEKGLCLDCPDSLTCGVCPVPFGPGVVGVIPASACRVQALMRQFTRPSCD